MRSPSVTIAGLLFLLSASAAQAQALIASQDFEGADLVGYSTLGGHFALNGADYLQRGSNGSPFTFEQPVTGFSGSNFIGLEDIDGAGLADPHWLSLNPVTVAGYTSLNVSLLVAAPSLLATRYEEEDFLLVEYSLDGAGYALLGRFVGSTGGGTLKHDTNLDGTGDVAIGSAMQRYTYSLGSATGSSLVVRVRFSSAGSQEEMAFDDIRITGLPPVASTCGNHVVEGAEVCDDGFTGACGACNATCTGAGTGSTCGDGVTCSETEACDDGFKDACGACNATCTGAGTGSTCGDGVACSQTEACDDGFTDVCGACNATCSGPGTGAACGQGTSCDAGQACDAGSQSDPRVQDAGVLAQDAAPAEAGAPSLAQDAGPLVQDPGPLAQDAGLSAASDACSADCQGDQRGAEAGTVREDEVCRESCPGVAQGDDAGMLDQGESRDEDNSEEEDDGEEKEEDINALEGMTDVDVDAGSAPRKRADGCSLASAPTKLAESPLLLLVLMMLLAVSARRRFGRR